MTAGIAAYKGKGLFLRPELGRGILPPSLTEHPNIARTMVITEAVETVALARLLVTDLARVYQIRGMDQWASGLGGRLPDASSAPGLAGWRDELDAYQA